MAKLRKGKGSPARLAITGMIAGDPYPLVEPVEGLLPTDRIVQAALTIKNSAGDPDANAVLQKLITPAAVAGTGQILNQGTSSPSLFFDFSPEETKLLLQARGFDVQVWYTENGGSAKIDTIVRDTIQAEVGYTDRLTLIEATTAVDITGYGGPLQIGSNVTLTAVPTDVNGESVPNTTATWVSSNTAALVVVPTGTLTAKVYAVGAGTTTITATVQGVSGTEVVQAAGTVASVTLDQATYDGPAETPVTLAATSRRADNSIESTDPLAFTWASSDEAVATVDAEGVVTPVAAGSATITATRGGVSGSCALTIRRSLIALAKANGGFYWNPLRDGLTPKVLPGVDGVPAAVPFEQFGITVLAGATTSGPRPFIARGGLPAYAFDGAQGTALGAAGNGILYAGGAANSGEEETDEAFPGALFRYVTLPRFPGTSTEPEVRLESAFSANEVRRAPHTCGFVVIKGRGENIGKRVIVRHAVGPRVYAREVTLTAAAQLVALRGRFALSELAALPTVLTAVRTIPGNLDYADEVGVWAIGTTPATPGVADRDLIARTLTRPEQAASHTNGVPASIHAPVGPLGMWIGSPARNYVMDASRLGGGRWTGTATVTSAGAAKRNPTKSISGAADGATSAGSPQMDKVSFLAGQYRGNNTANHLSLSDISDLTNSMSTCGVHAGCFVGQEPGHTLPADGDLYVEVTPNGGTGVTMRCDLVRERYIPEYDVWLYAARSNQRQPAGITTTSWDFRLYKQTAGDVGLSGVFVVREAFNPSNDERGPRQYLFYPEDNYSSDAGGTASAAVAGEMRPYVDRMGAILTNVAGVYVTRIALPYDPATALLVAPGTQQPIVQINDGGPSAATQGCLHVGFVGGFTDGSVKPRLVWNHLPLSGSGKTGTGFSVVLDGADAGLFSATHQHHDLVVVWDGRIVTKWAIDPTGPEDFRTDGIGGPASADWDYATDSTHGWAIWSDRDHRAHLRGWGAAHYVLRGATATEEEILAFLRTELGPRLHEDPLTGVVTEIAF